MQRSNFTSEIPIYQFPGGIHPEEHKTESNHAAIATLPLAKTLAINLKGQAGNRSIPIVSEGDLVLKGQVIAKNDGIFSSYQHAPTSGKIIAIEKKPIAHPSGLSDLCILLETDGQDNWCDLQPVVDFKELSREQLLARIFEAGIVGLGGASFPTHIKLQRESGIKTLIINAAECEPYITCDDRLLQEHAEQVLQGALIVSHLYHDLDIIIAIEDNKPAAIEALNQARQQLELSQCKIAVLPTKYPSGGEKQLIQLVTGKQVPHGGLPADLGLVVQNVGTCYAIHHAIIKGQPLVERLVTITGNACQSKGNYWVPFGTPIEHILSVTDCTNVTNLIMGGPMMGFEIKNKEVGIVKATNCIIASSDNELANSDPILPCIRCGACMDACPASLLPQQLYWHCQADEFDKAEDYHLFDCIECGACAYVCPSNIPLVQYYRYAKSTIRNNKIEKTKADRARLRHEARQDRIERVKREKAEKHKNAAEARRKAAEQTGQQDAKKAAVAAALARVQAKKQQQAEPINADDDKHKEES